MKIENKKTGNRESLVNIPELEKAANDAKADMFELVASCASAKLYYTRMTVNLSDATILYFNAEKVLTAALVAANPKERKGES